MMQITMEVSGNSRIMKTCMETFLSVNTIPTHLSSKAPKILSQTHREHDLVRKMSITKRDPSVKWVIIMTIHIFRQVRGI